MYFMAYRLGDYQNSTLRGISPAEKLCVPAAFPMIYFLWGSTFLAIRVGVREVPPLLLASMRFFIAGVVLFGWMRLRGTPSPSRREWLAASALAVWIFVEIGRAT